MQGARALHGHSTKLAKYASQVAGQRRNRDVLKVHEDFEYRATPQTPSAAIFKTVSQRGSICDKCRATDSQAPSQPRYIENSSNDRLSPKDSGCSVNWLA